MQICDFCGAKAARGDQTTIRRFRMDLADKEQGALTTSPSYPVWASKRHWWLFDLCVECLQKFVKDLDSLVQVCEDESCSKVNSKSTKSDLNRTV